MSSIKMFQQGWEASAAHSAEIFVNGATAIIAVVVIAVAVNAVRKYSAL